MPVNIGRQAIEISKRRHRADRAVGEERLEFLLLIKRDSFADCFLYFFQIDLVICRQHHHQMLPSRLDHDHFGVMPAFDVLRLSAALRRDRFGMMQNLIGHVVFI